MALILLIETASEVCSTAISQDGKVIACVEDSNCLNHAAALTLQVEACAREAGIPLSALDAVALSSGPGAYTSLRVGASVAKGICYALEKPLIAVDTLLALADAMRRRTDKPAGKELYMPALDARREEIWTALYGPEMQVLAPAQPLILTNNKFYDFIGQYAEPDNLAVSAIGGNGADKIRRGGFVEKAVFFTEIKCSAGHLSRLAEDYYQLTDFQDIAYWEPFYMKPPNITTPNNVMF